MPIYELAGCQPVVPMNNNYWVANNAFVVGEVELSSKVSIWFGAIIRGDNEKIIIASGTNIQENCVLHTDITFPLNIGTNCTIGHGAILHGCSIENNCIIGMGSIILNGTKIGKNCIVGAGSLITEHRHFLESGKLILGSPAKVVRDLSDEEIKIIEETALGYQHKMKIFKTTMRMV